MLDENLPTFVVKPSSDKPKQQSTLLYSQYGSDFEPAYSLRHLDPEQYASKNRYAVGLYDSFVSDVLYAEVLLIPEWTQPTLNAEQIRANGGVPPPPEPLLPMEFQIQLYNPDQQITVKYRPASFTKDPAWEFEMPIQTFREPSSSKLDRSKNDPVVSEHTPKVKLRWKKDSKFNKDLACYQSGKSMNPDGSKKKNKEPDITLAIFKALKEITLYEPNWNRVEIEDRKGFEVALLLGAIVIRDVYFSPMKDTFHLSAGGRGSSTTSPPQNAAILSSVAGAPLIQSPASGPNPALPTRNPRIPPTDPRTQWEIDTETTRLKNQAASEDKAQRRRDEAEQKRIRKMLEKEDKERQRYQAEVDKETERLRRLYGKEDNMARPNLPARPKVSTGQDPRRQSTQIPSSNVPHVQLQTTSWGGFTNPNHAPSAPYMSGAAAQSTSLQPTAQNSQHNLKPKSSFFGFRRQSDEDRNKLNKKRSSMW